MISFLRLFFFNRKTLKSVAEKANSVISFRQSSLDDCYQCAKKANRMQLFMFDFKCPTKTIVGLGCVWVRNKKLIAWGTLLGLASVK